MVLEREIRRAGARDGVVPDRLRLQDFFHPPTDRAIAGQVLEIATSALVLGHGPGPRLVRPGILQPPVVLRHRDPVVGIAHRYLWGLDRVQRRCLCHPASNVSTWIRGYRSATVRASAR